MDLGTKTDDARPRTYDVIETFTHPNFNGDDKSSNIILLKLNESVTFDEYVRPACLSTNQYSNLQQLLVVSWGDTNIRSDHRLKKVKMNYIPNETCKKNRPSYQMKYIGGIDNGTIFCAGPDEGDEIVCEVSKNTLKRMILMIRLENLQK